MSITYKLRIAVCDDTPADRQIILDLVEKYIDIHDYVIGIDQFSNAEELLAVDVTAYDLMVLDIFMGELNGIQAARLLIERHPAVQIIFCSTSNEFAAESYDVAALRYLTKPVSEEKLFQTLDRYFIAHTSLRTLTYKLNRMDESVYLSEILWIEAGDHKCIIHTKRGDIVTRTAFSALQEQLQGADFVKPIRYALVSLQMVATIPTDVFVLTDGTSIPISRDQRAQMKKAFSDYKMKSLLQRGGVR